METWISLAGHGIELKARGKTARSREGYRWRGPGWCPQATLTIFSGPLEYVFELNRVGDDRS
jgi:hypothetical protein